MMNVHVCVHMQYNVQSPCVFGFTHVEEL